MVAGAYATRKRSQRRWRVTVKVLGIETSSEACSVAVACDGRIFDDHRVIPRRHHHELLPMIEALLARAGVAPRTLGAIAFGAGPGSFTGLRIGASVAQALALAADCRVLGVSSLAVLARAALDARPTEAAVVVQPARPGEIYIGVYALESNRVVDVVADRIVRLAAADELAALVAHASGIAGAAAHALVRALPGLALRVHPEAQPRATKLLELALPELVAGRGSDPAHLELAYLSDASAWRKA